MPFLLRLSAQIQVFAARIQTACGKMVNLALEKVPPEKRRLLTMGAGGAFIVLLLVLAVVFIARGSSGGQPTDVSPRQRTSSMAIIPHDELFLPDEPDFVHGVMMEREQRTSWTAGDARPWWHDPLESGEEPWRSQIQKTVDEILESVP